MDTIDLLLFALAFGFITLTIGFAYRDSRYGVAAMAVGIVTLLLTVSYYIVNFALTGGDMW